MTENLISLSTDYLIVGAGAMGMSFLDELLTSSREVEAIVVDTRAAPGGHWNDAYSFVKLDLPALTYGINSRQLGEGGADRASKSLILEHYRQAMKDLEATGRVKFFPQCKYLGDGKFVSLLDSGVEYEVNVKAKIVNATCTMTNVPSTTEPNYSVNGGVSLIPINGLTDISGPWPNYTVVGGGKTGIDAVIYLLDHGVKPGKISWVVPNDCWYLDRSKVDDFLMLGDSMRCLVEVITDEKVSSQEQALLKLEDEGFLMRLDEDILPGRFRGPTVSKEEIKKLRQIKNVIRKGRIESIEPETIVFQSGEEMKITQKTLYIDCSASGTRYPPPKKVFDGNTINVQLFMMASPGMSANIIAAMELKFPEDEKKKNSSFQVLTLPHMPKDLFSCLYLTAVNDKAAQAELGMNFSRKRRVFGLHHVSFFIILKFMFYMSYKEPGYIKKLKYLMEEK